MKDSKNATAATGGNSGFINGVGDQKSAPKEVKIISQEFEEDNLITYREFVQAVKSIKDVDDPNPNERKFYESLLPRTLTFV